MSETNLATPADPVYLVWSILREQGFDAAQQCAVALAHDGVTPQIHADLCASAGHFEQAYHSASLGAGRIHTAAAVMRGSRCLPMRSASRTLRSTTANWRSAAQPEAQTIEWIVWLIDHCRAYSAAAHLLRAYAQRAPHDARAPWWLAVALASMPGRRGQGRATRSAGACVRARSGDSSGVAAATRAGVSRDSRLGHGRASVPRRAREASRRYRNGVAIESRAMAA